MLLTADEVAELLRTSRKAVYAMVERGQLPGVRRVGRRLLGRRADVVENGGVRGGYRHPPLPQRRNRKAVRPATTKVQRFAVTRGTGTNKPEAIASESGGLPPALAAEIRRLLTQILVEDMRVQPTTDENLKLWNGYDDRVPAA
jgi:excisionase family DNA binding protein